MNARMRDQNESRDRGRRHGCPISAFHVIQNGVCHASDVKLIFTASSKIGRSEKGQENGDVRRKGERCKT